MPLLILYGWEILPFWKNGFIYYPGTTPKKLLGVPEKMSVYMLKYFLVKRTFFLGHPVCTYLNKGEPILEKEHSKILSPTQTSSLLTSATLPPSLLQNLFASVGESTV